LENHGSRNDLGARDGFRKRGRLRGRSGSRAIRSERDLRWNGRPDYGRGHQRGQRRYKSTDAGKTWIHLGLDETKQIPSILVDPHNPNLVLVAAQGNMHVKSQDRGLYRSTDGGKTWSKTLFLDDQTGIQKIAWAYDRPDVILATTDRHYAVPGAGRGFGGGGGGAAGAKGTALFKSTDEGLTWKEIAGNGLPSLSGRTSVAVAMNTNAKRMFLVANSGLYRSDDGGAHWRQMDATDRRVANGQGGYNCGVYVDTKNPDVVYVINTSSYRSTDGGLTFTGFKGAPGGDDPQQMWIDPTDPRRMLLGSDQGATISLDSGQTWSSWYNQPTAQVYHISVDNSFPYWVYATQQDSGAIATRSRGDLGEITPLDWLPTPGYEFGSIVPDPLDPKIIYSGGPDRGIVKITYPSGQWINVSPNLDAGLKLRQVGNQPLLWSPTNPHELFAGFQYLMATTDGGKHWKKLSPDLGQPKTAPAVKKAATPTPAPKPDQAKPAGGTKMADDDDDDNASSQVAMADVEDDDDDNPDGQGFGADGGSIESIAPSRIDSGIIWVGDNNGLIKLTRNHGSSWQDVSIPKLPNAGRADITAMDASPRDPSEAYAAIDYHTTGDYAPYVYRTRDFGKTWTKIIDGLPTDQPSGSFARVVRSDTKRPGLLFLGTESSVYTSFDDGDHWQPLALNLPNTSFRDMVVKDNDLVVGTYGRGFWVLDDISPLRELNPAGSAPAVEFFKPATAVRVRRNVNEDTPFPPEIPHALNPPLGAVVYYSLAKSPTGPITLDVTDSSGALVRHMSSLPIQPFDEPAAPVPDFWLENLSPLPTNIGLNRTNWNLRYSSPPAFSHSYEINANPGQTPASPEGPLVTPGVYTLTLMVDGTAYKQSVTVKNDPRSPAREGDIRAQHDLQMKLYAGAASSWNGYQQVAAMRAAVKNDLLAVNTSEFTETANAFDAKLAAIGGQTGGGFRRGGGAAAGPTFVRVNGEFVRQINGADSGDMTPNEPIKNACKACCDDLAKVEANWRAFLNKELPAFNVVLVKAGLIPLSGA
jgi:photosystem II stability/assembly factor-like uncharacterized protein